MLQDSDSAGGLRRPDVCEADAATIASECYGLEVVARELGSNQDRNFVLEERDGTRSVLRVDNPVFEDVERAAQHAALDAYRAAGVPVPAVLPGLSGQLTERWRGLAVRRSEFAAGEPMVELGYLAPVVLEEFGALAAASVNALAELHHPGLDRSHMWDMRVALRHTLALAPSIADDSLRQRVLFSAQNAWEAMSALATALPVQAIHGDLTDDNVMGLLGADRRLHPHIVVDLGDLAYGWRVAELAVTTTALLAHEPERPLRVLDVIASFHRSAPLSIAEARALWPLIVRRACILITSGQRQLELEADNEYARARVAGERRIFDAATRIPLVEATELVLARLGFDDVGMRTDALRIASPSEPLRSLLPDIDGAVDVVDLSSDAPGLDAGRWLDPDTEQRAITAALDPWEPRVPSSPRRAATR